MGLFGECWRRRSVDSAGFDAAAGKRKGPPKLERPSLIFPLPFESQLWSNMVLHTVAHYVGVEPR